MSYLHFTAKRILRKSFNPNFRFVDVSADNIKDHKVEIEEPFINEINIDKKAKIDISNVYPLENVVAIKTNFHLRESFLKLKTRKVLFFDNSTGAAEAWRKFLDNSRISDNYKYGGLHYTGYILSNINNWCLPSWIWTNAALIRYYCDNDELKKAIELGELLMKNQLDNGGWIVRNDYNEKGAIPILAPNDSAYIANNAFLELYKVTSEEKYLIAAMKCADWIMSIAREDGLVWTGFNTRDEKWITDYVIVDTGFTAALFANLVKITGNPGYRKFLDKFVVRFIDLFYDCNNGGFYTSVNHKNKKIGGMFARGQAWALEGLIPAWEVLGTKLLYETIDNTIRNILNRQMKNGGWSYNFHKTFLGQDCKGIPVIGLNLMRWNNYFPSKEIIKSSVNALNWCERNTAKNNEYEGGIFSFCMEGAVVHNHYSSTAFVYSSAYALELNKKLNSI